MIISDIESSQSKAFTCHIILIQLIIYGEKADATEPSLHGVSHAHQAPKQADEPGQLKIEGCTKKYFQQIAFGMQNLQGWKIKVRVMYVMKNISISESVAGL